MNLTPYVRALVESLKVASGTTSTYFVKLSLSDATLAVSEAVNALDAPPDVWVLVQEETNELLSVEPAPRSDARCALTARRYPFCVTLSEKHSLFIHESCMRAFLAFIRVVHWERSLRCAVRTAMRPGATVEQILGEPTIRLEVGRLEHDYALCVSHFGIRPA